MTNRDPNLAAPPCVVDRPTLMAKTMEEGAIQITAASAERLAERL